MIQGTVSELAAALRNRYVLERELGHGGMATVYLARDLKHKRPVALKVLRPELAATLGPDRFRREIETAAGLQHPHICSVYDSGETAGWLWFTMPYVRGESLRERLRREGRLPVEQALRITTEAGRALDFAHREGFVHRDVKPENLLLTTEGDTLVADFGIVRALAGAASEGQQHLTETGIAIGTAAYMAPEQATGERTVDARADQYALAVTCYEMLAGQPPFNGPTQWVRLELALILAEATGARLGAINGLKWSDISYKPPRLHWRAEFDKRGRDRVVPITESLAQELLGVQRRLGVIGKGWLFPTRDGQRPWRRELFAQKLLTAEQHAGLEHLKGGVWHPFRR